MRRFNIVKNIITIGLVAYFLYCFALLWFRLGTEYSIEAAGGFMLGLLFMAGLFLEVKMVRYLCNEFNSWLIERKHNRAGATTFSRWYEEN